MVIIEVCQETAGVAAHAYSPDQPITESPHPPVFTMPPETVPPPLQDIPTSEIPVVNGISTLEEQDVEERLEQLLLQDDLTDARIEEMATSAMEKQTNEVITAENHLDSKDVVDQEDVSESNEERQQNNVQFTDKWVCLWVWSVCVTERCFIAQVAGQLLEQE